MCGAGPASPPAPPAAAVKNAAHGDASGHARRVRSSISQISWVGNRLSSIDWRHSRRAYARIPHGPWPEVSGRTSASGQGQTSACSAPAARYSVPRKNGLITSILAGLPDGRLVIGDELGAITIVDVESREVDSRIPSAHTAPVRTLRLAPDHETLASGGQDNAVRLWDVSTWNEIGLLRNPGAVRDLEFVDGGLALVAVDINGNAVLWDVQWWRWPEQVCEWLDGSPSWWPAGKDPFHPVSSKPGS